MSRHQSQCSPPYARSSTTPGSIGSASVSSIVRRKNARDIFDEYGIARPENWLSEENSESGGAKPRPQPQLPASITKLEYRRCHSCRRYLPTGKECPECGHESCIKCTDEMPLDSFSLIDTTTQPRPLSGRYHEAVGRDVSQTSLHKHVDSIESVQRSRLSHTKSLTPKPLASGSRKLPVAKQDAIVEERDTSRRVVSDTLKNNPFVQADSIQKGLALEPQIHPHNVVARRPTELSDCLPQRHMDRSASDSTAPGECDNRSCRQLEGGIRHSVGCTSRRKALQQLASREWNADRYVHERVRQNQHAPLQDPLQRKIDQLYHRSDDLYRSQHIIEHLAAGTRMVAESLERESPNFSERDRGSVASVQSDPRLHSLGADVMDEVEQLVRDYSLHQNSVAQFGEQHTSPSLHSLHADERTDEPDSISAHSLQDDSTIQRELSPLSLGNRGEINKSAFTALPLQPTQRLHTLKSLSPRSILDQVTSFPKPKTRNALGISKSSSDLKSAQAVTPNDRGVVSGTVKARKSVIEDRSRSQARISVSQKRKHHQPRSSNKEPVAETWPQLKPVGKVAAQESWHVADTSAPWSRHALREVQAHQEHSLHRHDTPNLFSLRQQLRKVEAPEPPKAVKPPTPPLSQLRRSPGRLIATPPTKDINCGNCNPSDTPSSVQEGSSTGVVAEQHELNSHALAEHTATHPQVGDARGEWREILQSPSRMRLRDLEHTLARHSAEDLQSLQGGKTSTKRNEASLATPLDLLPMSGGGDPHIHNPRPFLPPDHACEWRARCMDLNSEVEQLKSEMSEMESNHTFEQRSEPLVRGYISVGVGDTMAQHECHEFGIEGLTIVLHMRGKDDLVINTDLAKETPPI
jgi:hypothetical protein